MRILTMGSLYFNREPLPPGYHIQEEGDLSLGNTIPGRALQWVQVGELLIANRCVCTGVSWDDLNSLGTSLATQFASTEFLIRVAASGCGAQPTNGMKF